MKRLLSLFALILTVVSTNAQEVFPGDAYKDNNIDGKDITEVVNAIMESPDLSDNYSKENADANNDQTVNVADIVSIVNILLKNGEWTGGGGGGTSEPKSLTLNATVTFDNWARIWGIVGSPGKKKFAQGDKLALVYKSKKSGFCYREEITLSSKDINNDGSANITQKIAPYDPDYGLEVYYPADIVSVKNYDINVSTALLNVQYGSAVDVCTNRLFFKARIDDSGFDDNTLDANVNLEYQFTVLQLRMYDENQNNITSNISYLVLQVTSPDNQTRTHQIYRGDLENYIYVVLPPVEKTSSIKINAHMGSDEVYKQRIVNEEYVMNKVYDISMKMGKERDVSNTEGIITVNDGDVLTGTLPAESTIRIPANATVVLNNLNISNADNEVLNFPGIEIRGLGKNTLILEGTNVVRGTNKSTPGIGAPGNGTLVITGSGSLDVSSGTFDPIYNNSDSGAGIFAGRLEIYGGTIIANANYKYPGIYGCRGVYIYGGDVTSRGAPGASGIGGYEGEQYGHMVFILGGTVKAIGGEGGAAIGSGRNGSCDNITISEPTKRVTLIKGGDGTEYIGKGSGSATCGTITIDGVVNATTTSKLEHYGWLKDGNNLILGHSSQ
jgi:hypothetical protein